MTRRIPLIPTIIVAAAVAVMIGLGVWQLQRAKWKEGLLNQYAEAEKLPPIAFPTLPMKDAQLPLFRHATGICLRPTGKRTVPGEGATSREPGFVHIVDCATGAEGPGMSVAVGWSKDPNAAVNWSGGPVSGIIAPDNVTRLRLVAATAPPGLEAVAPPSLASISNNHRSYAIQWFAFALIATIIYALALRSRWKKEPQV
ncbi:SURF1 family cytochrome oxidase biogenesis protein [Sphingomonas daechungensis]|uniref:SURF1 family cytochrome oxidase biogenesis protein n=1 Tax=Sphingomonas daechungensis TaxID=1176646 RepID=UPI003782DC18